MARYGRGRSEVGAAARPGSWWNVGLVAVGLAAVGLLLASLPAAAAATRRPASVGVLAGGDLIVLETDGGLLRVDPESDEPEVLVAQFRPYLMVDMAVAPAGRGREIVLASLRLLLSGGGQFNRLVEYSTGGERGREWPLASPSLFAGLAVDRAQQMLYVSDAYSGEIHSLAYGREGASLQRLLRLRGVTILGPLALDEGTQRLFAADTVQGTLYAIPLASKVPVLLAESLGEPAAMAVDRERRQLLVADAAGRRIWRLDLDAEEPTPELFSRAEELRSPVGLAVAPDGKIWVADPRANKLFALGADGGVVQSIP